MRTDDIQILAVDNIYAPLPEKEAEALKPLLKTYTESYLREKEAADADMKKWLTKKMAADLPDRDHEEVAAISDEIVSELARNEEDKKSLEKALSHQKSKEYWFADKIKSATSLLPQQKVAAYMQMLDDVVQTENAEAVSALLKKGANPHLDGFAAEQYQVHTFNMNAAATGSGYRAKIPEADGALPKNSVDIEVLAPDGKPVSRYQVKYYKDAEATAKAFENGDYRGQQKLVPADQAEYIDKKVTTTIEAPDGTKSNPLTKEEAQLIQKDVQSGKTTVVDWNDYQIKNVAKEIAIDAGQGALFGMAVGVGTDIAEKLWKGEKIDGEELMEKGLATGADFGIKAALTGALKVGVEKGLLGFIPKGTPAARLANIVHIGIENVKIIGKIAKGECTFREGMAKISETTVSTMAGIATSVKGSQIGVAIGTVIGPVGSAVGAFVGGAAAYMAGSKFGETVVRGARKIKEKIVEGARKIKETVGKTVQTIREKGKAILKRLFA